MMRPARGTVPFGDINAPPDSAAYAVALKLEAQGALNAVESDVTQLEGWLDLLRDSDRYRKLDSPFGHPFASWADFCTAPQPFGLGYSPAAIAHLIAERKAAQQLAADPAVKALSAHGGAHTERDGQVDNINLGGTGASYLVRRLKRDAPDVAEALGRGEYPSARAAAIAAGIITPLTRLQWLELHWRKATAAERRDFLAWIGGRGEEAGRACPG